MDRKAQHKQPVLFDGGEERPSAPASGPFASVALERAIDGVLDYAVPARLAASLRVGQRVKVPLGRRNRPTYGYVTAISPTTSTTAAIKQILSVDDQRVLVPPALMELALWMARYYCCPLGTVLNTIVPSAVKKRIGVRYALVARLARAAEEVHAAIEKTRSPKRRAVLARMLQLGDGESIDVAHLAREAGTTIATVRKTAQGGLIEIARVAVHDAPPAPARPPVQSGAAVELNADQRRVLEQLRPRLAGGFSVTLLFGVTCSGKTEIYLQAIRQVIEQGRRAIVLVPEIALTPQTVARFTGRFARVAVLHSALPAALRHRYWQQIADGGADVVVGARSAIFAPQPDLGIIVVDEEHEGSYKQDSAPRYHARDLAVKRGQLENVPVLLGSATPSLESWLNAQPAGTGVATVAGRYHLAELPRRVGDLALPEVEIVDMVQETRHRGRVPHLLSRRLEHLLRQCIDEGHQAILLLNRRGYASYVFCASCGNVVQCRYCSAGMTYHRDVPLEADGASFEQGRHTGELHCHYCLNVSPLPPACPACGKKLCLFGLGTQRVEEELRRRMPELRFARVDSDSMQGLADYADVMARFARGELQCMLGTQMIAKGLDYPNVTLVGIISGDTALSLPDFRAAERTFQLITQVAGRAGRGSAPGRVVVQTFMPQDPTIQAAIRQDYRAFAAAELAARRQCRLPPVTRMARIVVRDQDQQKAADVAGKVAEKLALAVGETRAAAAVRGPMPCVLERIAGYWRMQILLISDSAGALQAVLTAARKAGALGASQRIAVDVDPVALL